MAILSQNDWKNSLFLISEILEKRLFLVDEGDLTYIGGRHALLGVHFSDEIKNEPVLSPHLKEVVEGFVRLFFFVEEEPALKIPRDFISNSPVKLSFTEDFTGMSGLLLFAKGDLQLRVSDDLNYDFQVQVSQRVVDSIPDATYYVKLLVERILRFGEFAPFPMIQVLLEEKKEEPGELPLDDSFSPAYKANLKQTLGEIHHMITDIDDHSEDAKQMSFSFSSGKLILVGHTCLRAPDGFQVGTNEDTGAVVLFIENPDNPGVYEASHLAFEVYENEENAGVHIHLLSSHEPKEKGPLKEMIENQLNSYGIC